MKPFCQIGFDRTIPTTRETILVALQARLSALPATALRGAVLPECVPTEGLLILRDGEPGEAEGRRGPSLLVADRARINMLGQAVASRSKTGRFGE